MERIQKGIMISPGTAKGTIRIMKRREVSFETEGKDWKNEWNRFCRSRDQAAFQLLKLKDSVAFEEGKQLLDAHLLILEDEEYEDLVKESLFEKNRTAESAVKETGNLLAERFEQMDDPYFRERSLDIRDVTERMLLSLTGNQREPAGDTHPYLLVTEELLPTELLMHISSGNAPDGVVIGRGGRNSHSAILLRMLGIPALSGIAVSEVKDGEPGELDGEQGILIIAESM